jgi:hypothetical protein
MADYGRDLNIGFPTTGFIATVDTSSGDAVAANIANGKIAWVKGVEITGTHV